MDPTEYMKRAIELSREKMADGSGSYCATLIVKDGEVVGEGWNTVNQTSNPVAHCEINAIQAAGQRLGTWNLSGCDLYTTWEPCPLCVAAIWWAKIDRVFYANLLSDVERLGFDLSELHEEMRAPVDGRSRPYTRLLGDEAFAVVQEWYERDKPEPIV